MRRPPRENFPQRGEGSLFEPAAASATDPNICTDGGGRAGSSSDGHFWGPGWGSAGGARSMPVGPTAPEQSPPKLVGAVSPRTGRSSASHRYHRDQRRELYNFGLGVRGGLGDPRGRGWGRRPGAGMPSGQLSHNCLKEYSLYQFKLNSHTKYRGCKPRYFVCEFNLN